MDAFQSAYCQELCQTAVGPCISIYFLPEHTWPDSKQNVAWIKTSIRDIEERLAARGVEGAVIEELLQPIRRRLADESSWSRAGNGIAMFRSPVLFREFKLAGHGKNECHVGSRFHVLPLIARLAATRKFHVLAVSKNGVRLFEANGDDFGEVPSERLPSDLVHALGYDRPQAMFQAHGGVTHGKAARDTVFHGQGGQSDFIKEELAQYFRMIDRALQGLLTGMSVPLMFAGVDYLFPIYRQENTYPLLLEDHISGNPDLMDNQELNALATQIIARYAERENDKAVAQVSNLIGSDCFSTDLEQVILAAQTGQVNTLLIAEGAACAGVLDTMDDRIKLFDRPTLDSEDLLNLAGAETLAHGGRVFMCAADRIPGRQPIAASFRYAPVTIETVARMKSRLT